MTYGFFCMSDYDEDLVLAATIASAIANKINKKLDLYVKFIPDWHVFYPTIDFIDELPIELLRLSRKPAHQELVDIEDALLLNAWVTSQRGLFLNAVNGDRIAAACEVLNDRLQYFNLRRKMSVQQMLDHATCNTTVSSVQITKPTSFVGKYITVVPNELLDEFTGEVGSLDVFGFFLESGKYHNISCFESNQDIPWAIQESDFVFAVSQEHLLPFFRFVKNKKIVLLQQVNQSVFNDIEVVDGISGAISYFSSVAH